MRPTPIIARAAALALFAAGPALAQDDGLATGAVPGDVGEAAQMLGGAAENALLLRDLLGTEVSDPGGETIGTVENFVVIPGGRIVAAVLESADGARVPVPFAAVKLSATAGRTQAVLDRPLSELRADADFDALESAVPDLGG